MFNTPKARLLPMLSCVVVAGAANLAHAQFGISFDESGEVRIQDGNKPPLVVGPGQSFGGTLTPQGFQGVKVGPDNVAVQVAPNPFQAAPSVSVVPPSPAVPRSGMKINAGGVSVSLPNSGGPVAVAVSDPSMKSYSMSEARELARTAKPKVALKYVEEMLKMSPHHSDALQLKATLVMQSRPREAAAAVYDALNHGPAWTWPMLRSRYAQQEDVVAAYRHVRQASVDDPTTENLFLLSWWERMLNHPAESMAAMQQAYTQKPKDPLLNRLMSEWAVVETADAPPAPQQ